MNFLQKLHFRMESFLINLKFARSPSRFANRRKLVVIVAMTTVLLLMTSLEMRRSRNAAISRDRFQSRSLILPDQPESEKEAMLNLFDFLTADRASERLCRKLVRLGGTAEILGNSSAVIVGDHVACVDRPMTLAKTDCLAVSLAGCEERSFSLAAEHFGCRVITAPQCLAPKSSSDTDAPQPHPADLEHVYRLLKHLTAGSTEPIISYMAVNAPAQILFDLLEPVDVSFSTPHSVWKHVQQIGFVLNMTDGVDVLRQRGKRSHWLELEFGLRLYSTILRLQSLGLVMYDIESVRTLESVSIHLPQRRATIDTVLRTSWMKL